jgi:cell division protein FtsB
MKVKRQIENVSAKLSNVREEIESLQTDVSLLDSKTLDLDILEERCRAILGYSFPEDVIVKSGKSP